MVYITLCVGCGEAITIDIPNYKKFESNTYYCQNCDVDSKSVNCGNSGFTNNNVLPDTLYSTQLNPIMTTEEKALLELIAFCNNGE